MNKLTIGLVVVVIVVVVLTLPAAVVAPRFDLPADLGRFQGTVWTGQARWMQTGQEPVAVHWRWAAGRRWHWQARGPGVALDGDWRPGNGVHLRAVAGRLAVERLDLSSWLLFARPTGQIELALDRVVLIAGQRPRIDGRAEWQEAGLQGTVQESLGRVEVEFASDGEPTRAIIRSLEAAAITVRGTLEFDSSNYHLDLWLRAAAHRPDLTRQLGQLGEPQADGQVRIRLSGATGWSI